MLEVVRVAAVILLINKTDTHIGRLGREMPVAVDDKPIRHYLHAVRVVDVYFSQRQLRRHRRQVLNKIQVTEVCELQDYFLPSQNVLLI